MLLTLFAWIAWVAVRSKSPTFDEPLHAVGAWLHLHKGDFRVNPEDPPLWHYWAALPNGENALNPRMDDEWFKIVADDVFREWAYVVEVLYGTAGNDGEAIVMRSRAMMLIVAVVLGGVIAWWSWKLGGVVAALVATAAFALDPNFLAHGPLVKNDVSLTLVMLLLVIAVWRAGRRLSVWNALAICLLCGAGLNVKFSALLLGPMVLILLLSRAVARRPWVVLGRELHSRGWKAAAALGVCIAAFAMSFVSIWAVYGFRYTPTRDPNLLLNTENIVDYLRMNELVFEHGEKGVRKEHIDRWEPGLFSSGVLWLEQKRLLPQAWLNGLLYTQQSAVLRKTYLLGEFSMTGWWYYFPITMLVKSPLALLCATAGALGVGLLAWRRERSTLLREQGWTVSCFAVPVGVYMLASMTSNLNLGIRHVLPVYPFVLIAIGTAAAYAWRSKPRTVKITGTVLVTVLGIETLSAFPNYIAFFNAAAGGSRGGIHILGDSNLDWGQDLKLLAEWQQKHPGVDLSLCYFGMADPKYYGVSYRNLRGGYFLGPPFEPPRVPGIVAVSATHLQGIYLEDDLRRLYNGIWKELTPKEILGGTIYLYEAMDVLQLAARQRQANPPPLAR
ncbi:MAG TPA: glycosyltransferase family 39 protein [Tepidisphaeraceae bacterium]|nr:glycosyltransferase family 39 protein [Tepidisphaeraceae bacterium]